jgi:hypothetical protein
MPDDVQREDRWRARSRHHRPGDRPPRECVALLLQGGGASRGDLHSSEGLSDVQRRPGHPVAVSPR